MKWSNPAVLLLSRNLTIAHHVSSALLQRRIGWTGWNRAESLARAGYDLDDQNPHLCQGEGLELDPLRVARCLDHLAIANRVKRVRIGPSQVSSPFT
jgi:hypothetical protein